MIKVCEWCGAEYKAQAHVADKRRFCSLACNGARSRTIMGAEDILARSSAAGNGCVEWGGPLDRDGYGSISYKGRKALVHRLMLSFTKGDQLIKGRVVMHSCDNRRCVNPEHLSVGSQADNLRDMVTKNRHARKSSHGMAVLSDGDVETIRALAGQATNAELAAMFGVSAGNISLIKANKRW